MQIKSVYGAYATRFTVPADLELIQRAIRGHWHLDAGRPYTNTCLAKDQCLHHYQ